MKKIILLACLFTTANATYAQSPLPIHKTQLNLGVGLSNWGVPIYAGVDYGINRDLSLGLEFSTRSYNENWNNGSYHHTVSAFIGNANYHFNTALNIPTKYDFYAGLNIGFNIWNSPTAYTGNHTSGLAIGAQIGGRYYLSQKTALNLEFGGGNSATNSKFGLSIIL